MTIDLAQYLDQNETSLIGEEFGKKIRSQMPDLIELENSDDQIVIIVPNTIVTISKSFFMACFMDRVKDLGKIRFSRKYYFHASKHFQRRVSEIALDVNT